MHFIVYIYAAHRPDLDSKDQKGQLDQVPYMSQTHIV